MTETERDTVRVAELEDRIKRAIAAAIGVLHIVAHEIMRDHD